jgi:hypothetical protein
MHRHQGSWAEGWSVVSGIDFEAYPVPDSVNANKFYTYDPSTGVVYGSTDAGQSFRAGPTIGNGGYQRLAAVPGVEGDVWAALEDGGLARSTDSAASFTLIGSVQSAVAVGFGKAAPDSTFPTAYIWGAAAGGPRGLYRSTDEGAGWVRINDDSHEFGGPGNARFVVGDANVYGRVYMATVGRGIVYGEPNL